MSKDTSFDTAFTEIKAMQCDTNRMIKSENAKLDKRAAQPVSTSFSKKEFAMIFVTVVVSYLLAKFVL